MNEKFDKLVEVMEILRSEKGCPWDREQTHESLRRFLIEETYEALEALDNQDFNNFKEELGDVLLQIVFHSQLSKEEGRFTINDVIDSIVNKLISRHPHVFNQNSITEAADPGAPKPSNAKEVEKLWNDLKKSEKRKYLLDGVPDHLPALLRSMRISEKAATAGFDWKKPEDIFYKIEEELLELKAAFISKNQVHTEEELGDLITAVVNLARHLKIDPEKAVNLTTKKFIRRFNQMEEWVFEKEQKISDLTLEEMEALWQKAKKLQH